jgi:hypothetical protein
VDREPRLQPGVEPAPAPEKLEEAAEREVEGRKAPERPEELQIGCAAKERRRRRDEQERQLSRDLPGRPGRPRRERDGEKGPGDEGRDRKVDRRDTAKRTERVAARARGAGAPGDEGRQRQAEADVRDADPEGEGGAEDEKREGGPLEAAAAEDRGKKRLR